MIQEHDSDGNPACIYCGTVMRPVKRSSADPVPQEWIEVGYRNSRIFCSKNCGFIYGLILAHFRLQTERDKQCLADTTTTSPQPATCSPSSAQVLTQGPHGVSELQSGSVSMASCIYSLDTLPAGIGSGGGGCPSASSVSMLATLGELGFGDATST